VKVRDLIRPLENARVIGNGEIDIRGVAYDSRQVEPGFLFVALKGVKTDGRRFIKDAISRGASAILAEEDIPEAGEAIKIVFSDCRVGLALVSAEFYGYPSRELTVVGVTGTNGKTTTTYLLESIFNEASFTPGVLGTIDYRIGGKAIGSGLTTPEALDLQRIFRQMRDAHVSHVAMEVSSHAIDLRRIDGCQFAAGIFTNLSQDHLDYHGDLEKYGQVKKHFFTHYLSANRAVEGIVVNGEDTLGQQIAREFQGLCWQFGLEKSKDTALYPSDIKVGRAHMSFNAHTPMGIIEMESHLIGIFNVANILGAVGAALLLGIPKEVIQAGVTGLVCVPGRCEPVENDRGLVILVDYAHTPEALKNTLTELNKLPKRRIITVFGCGGDRDKGKRPLMGQASYLLSDLAIVTSDNPRTEDPKAIIRDILVGLADIQAREITPREAKGLPPGDKGFLVDADRKEAIYLALSVAQPGDVILIAGKGHEDYQIIGTTKHHFDDREEALAALALRGGAR
jgi:UDP-N-acetylmuramoyl-L-alanyl-D-glutamate--2,6-diaminopimelate ligase